jgi:hypothetical protein
MFKDRDPGCIHFHSEAQLERIKTMESEYPHGLPE